MHACNAYCGDGQHCDVYYSSAGATEDDLWQALARFRGLKVLRAEPAREAAPPPVLDRADVIIVGKRPAVEPWLVWYV